MKIFLSLFCVIGFLCMDAFFAGLVIILGFMDNWVGMVKYYIAIVLFVVVWYLAFPCPWSIITIKEHTILSKIPFVSRYEIDCNKTVYYLFFQDQIEAEKRAKDYIMLSYHDLSRLPPEKHAAWKFDFRKQIVLPYTKKTEPMLRQWIDSDHWICCGRIPLGVKGDHLRQYK